MTDPRLITQSSTKRVTAAAIGDAKARRSWSNADAGDALGVAEGTIRNRLEADCPKHQMTVFELLRALQSDGVAIPNRIMADAGYEVVPTVCASATDAIVTAGRQAHCASEIIAAAVDAVITREEWRRLMPVIVQAQADLAAMAAQGRAALDPP